MYFFGEKSTDKTQSVKLPICAAKKEKQYQRRHPEIYSDVDRLVG